MTEPVRLLHRTGEPWIEYHQFILFDVESRYSRTELRPQADGAIAASGNGGALFFTLGEMTDVVVEFELWSAQPGLPEQSYEWQHEGEFTVETGRLVLGSTTGSPADVVIDLPAPGPFKLRAFRNSEASVDPEFPDIDHHDEQWLIQVWPVG